jgi:hypothetical protein
MACRRHQAQAVPQLLAERTLKHVRAGWYAAHMLAEAAALGLPGRGSDTRAGFLRCQTDESIDDILVGFSDGGNDLFQAKRRHGAA